MELTFWGVRGCIPAPGAEFTRYGGNTSCVAVKGGQGELLILDAGTGLIGFGKSLMQQEFGKGQGQATLILTHAHWDHIQGFPFFGPVHVPGNRLRVFCAHASPCMVEELLEGQMNPHFMPVQSLRNLRAEIGFGSLAPQAATRLGSISISSCWLPHGKTDALAIRLSVEGGRSVVFAPDAGYPNGEPGADALALYQGAHTLIHDCTYSEADYQRYKERGYSSVAIAARTAVSSGAQRLVMFHYDQDYGDERLDALVQECRQCLDSEGGSEIELVAAQEGMTLEV